MTSTRSYSLTLCHFLTIVFCLVTAPLAAQSVDGTDQVLPGAPEQEVVDYPSGFFARYQPNTALDMVEQVPGFQLDDGSGERGFGVAAGNILINDRRLSAKQDLPSAILDRIPASHVERIELIRGQVQGIDLRGQAVVANVILRDDVPAAVRWEARFRKNLTRPKSIDATTPELFVSLSDRWQSVDYNTGVSVYRRGTADDGTEQIFNGSGDLIEDAYQEEMSRVHGGSGNLNLSTALGATLLQFNGQLAYQHRDDELIFEREPLTAANEPREESIGTFEEYQEVELGVDAERGLTNDLIGKAIVLFYHQDRENYDELRIVEDAAGETLFRGANSDTYTTEAIGRLEFDWIGWQDHAVQFNVETAFNSVDGSLVQTDDTGAGPVIVDVPGANTRVEELRGDLLVKDTWTLGDWILDYGLGAEVSEISQTGDAELTRDFFFIKPQGLITWAPSQDRQTRLRVAREAAQLDLNDFVSATVFVDEDLALGNPNLKPETTWLAELSHERRFGELGVVTLTLFHDWISDVQDLIPITDEFEAPGNIGDGRRWGVELETTLPLEPLGLTGARLDLQARWQDSTVTDPVTGEDRFLTGEPEFFGQPSFAFNTNNEYEYIFDIAFRQDLEDARVAWGWDIAERGERIRYKVNELDVYDDTVELNAFIETTRWWGLKFRLQGDNLLNYTEIRDRDIYSGLRGLSPLARRELGKLNEGARLSIQVSGSF